MQTPVLVGGVVAKPPAPGLGLLGTAVAGLLSGVRVPGTAGVPGLYEPVGGFIWAKTSPASPTAMASDRAGRQIIRNNPLCPVNAAPSLAFRAACPHLEHGATLHALSIRERTHHSRYRSCGTAQLDE